MVIVSSDCHSADRRAHVKGTQRTNEILISNGFRDIPSSAEDYV